MLNLHNPIHMMHNLCFNTQVHIFYTRHNIIWNLFYGLLCIKFIISLGCNSTFAIELLAITRQLVAMPHDYNVLSYICHLLCHLLGHYVTCYVTMSLDMSLYVTWCHVTRYVTMWLDMSLYVTWCYVTCYVIISHAMSLCHMLCHMICHMSHHSITCYMLCHYVTCYVTWYATCHTTVSHGTCCSTHSANLLIQ